MDDDLAGVGLVLEAPGGQGHMAPCVVKDLVEGSASHACGGISPGDILLSVDNVPVQGMSVDEIAGLIIGESGTKVVLNFESAGREKKGKSRMYSRRLTRGRATGTYSAASSAMNSPVLSAASASFKIPDIDRDPLGTTGDPGSSVAKALSSLNSYLPEIPRLSLKSLRSAPATSTSTSAREEREQSRPSWMRDSWLPDREAERPQTERAFDVVSSGRAWSTTSSFTASPADAFARESAASRAIELTKMTRDELSRDLLAPHESVTKGFGINRTTVGISYEEKNQTITQTLVGSPAFNSRKVHKGDVIVAIDGEPVADDGKDIQDRLKGVDVPGSSVVISLRKASGYVEHVRLQRMKSSLIADKRKLFDLFTKASDRAKKDDVMEKYIEDAVELWTQTMIEEHDHDVRCEENVGRMQKSCGKWLEELLTILGKGNMDLSGQMQVRLAALEVENSQSKDELRAATNKTMSLWRDVEILQAEISGNKRWAKSQIINAKLEAEVTRREMLHKTRIIRERENSLNDALKDAARFQAEAEELRRQLMQQKDTTRIVERDLSKTQAENAELREQLQKAEAALKKAQDWNEQNSGRDSAEVLRLKKIIKENESEILRLNKEIHELKLQKQKAFEEVEVCRKDVTALQQIRAELESEVKRQTAVTDAQQQKIHGLEELLRSLNDKMQQAKQQWEADRTSLLQRAQREKEQAVAAVREQMEREFQAEREQLRISQKQVVGLKAEIEQLSYRLQNAEREWQAKLSEEQRLRTSLEAELENSRVALSNLRASHEHDILKIRHEMETALKELQQRDRDIRDLQEQVVKLTRENNGLEQHVRDLQVEIERLRAEFKSREQHVVEMQQELEKVTRSLRDVKLEIEDHRNRCMTAEEEARRLRVAVDEYEDALSRARAELANRKAREVEEINKANETKYQLDVLNQELEHLKRGMALKTSAKIAELQQRLREEMRKNAGYDGRMRQTLEAVRKLHLEGKVVLTDKLEHVSALLASLTDEVIRMRSSDAEYESIIRSLREELVKVRETKDFEILNLQTSNRDLQAALDNANRRIHDYEQEVYEVRAELATYKRDLEKLQAERNQWEINMQRLRDELAEKSRQIEKITRPLESQILALNKQVHELSVALEKMTEKYNVATETLRKEVEKVRSLEFEIEELKRKLGRLPEIEREMKRELEREAHLRANLEKEMRAKDAELDKLRVQITSLQKELNQKNDALARTSTELKQRSDEAADLRRRLQETERNAAADKKRFEGIIFAKDEEIEKLRKQLTEMRGGVSELNQEILVLRNNQADKDALMRYQRQLQEAWNIARELEMQVHSLQREALERKQWAVSKAQRVIFKVEEAWKDRLRKEMNLKQTALRERDIARRECEDLKRHLAQLSERDQTIRQQRAEIDDLKSQLRHLGDKDSLIRQLRTEVDSHKAQIARLQAELDSLRAQRDKLLPDRDRAHLIRCRELIRLVSKVTQNVCLSEMRVVTASVSDACTLGFSYVENPGKQTVVSHVLTGGPAFKSKRMHKGDYILLVDGAEVAGDSMTEALKGSNQPGSKVRLTIKKKDTGKIEVVELVRTLTATIADKRRLFDLFCEIENAITRLRGDAGAAKTGTAKTGKEIEYVTEAMELWGKMELEQVLHDERSQGNISSMQADCAGWLQEMHRLLGQDLDAIKFDVAFNKDVHQVQRDRHFETNLCHDLASAINGEASKISVRNFNTGTNMATILLHTGVCGGNMTPFEAARLLTGQVSESSSPLRKGNYSKYVMSITNVEAVEDTSSPAFNSSSGFSLFGPSSPIAHETQFSSRRGSTPKGTEFSKRSPAKEEDPMNDPRVKATILDLQSKIREMEAELSRKEKELMEVSRKLAQTESKAQQTAAELEKMRGENTSLRLSPSKSADSNIEINFLRKDLDRAKAELQDARSENQALASSLRGRERAYDELQEAKVKAATEVLDLQRENRQLKRELDSKLNLQSSPVRQSPRTTPTSSLARGPTEVSPRASGGSSSRLIPTREEQENGSARTGSGQWDDNFFSNIFGTQPAAKGGSRTGSRTGSLDDENWDDSYFMDLLGDDLPKNSPRHGAAAAGRRSPAAKSPSEKNIPSGHV